MLRFFQIILAALVFLVTPKTANGFSLYGQLDNWQTSEVGFTFGEQGGSKNIGEEFRLNTPTLTYGFDPSFLDYFGTNGIKAVDQAMAIMNKIPPVSKMTPELTEFLTQDAQRGQRTAETLFLLDVKSQTLGYLIEHMGLSGEEHVYDLRKRIPFPGTCQFNYEVDLRNFDPVTYGVTPYVNGTLYGYDIVDFCPVRQVSFAVENPVDETDIDFTAVASFKGGLLGLGQRFGGYYLNITRDDAGGLRYIYNRNNFNYEGLPTNAVASFLSGPFAPVNFFTTNNAASNSVARRAGIEKVTFTKLKTSPIFGTVFKPFVQSYSSRVADTNLFKVTSQNVRRVVLEPDILFTAADLGTLPGAIPLGPFLSARSIIFQTNGLSGFAASIGPGIIYPQTVITFHKSNPQFFNSTPFFLNDLTSFPGFLWASFDGSTNDPVIYPQGTSIRTIENLILRP